MTGNKVVTFMKFVLNYQLSRGEICVANFIPLVNGASLGRYKVYVMSSTKDLVKVHNMLYYTIPTIPCEYYLQ